MNRESILKKYYKVFDIEGEIKPCGRYECMGLIQDLNKVKDEISKLDFGDEKTGMTNPEDIKKFINLII